MLRRFSILPIVLLVAFWPAALLTAQQPGTPPAPTGAPPAAGPRGGGRGAPPVKSPEVGADGRVTFRLRAPNAREVAAAIAGNRLVMQKDDQGVWSVTSE